MSITGALLIPFFSLPLKERRDAGRPNIMCSILSTFISVFYVFLSLLMMDLNMKR